MQFEIFYFEAQTGGSFLLCSHSTGSQQVLKVKCDVIKSSRTGLLKARTNVVWTNIQL